MVTVQKTVEIELDAEVVKQGLRADNPILGEGASLNAVVEHLAYNLVGNDLRLSEIDGYANLPDSMARVPGVDWDVEVDP